MKLTSTLQSMNKPIPSMYLLISQLQAKFGGLQLKDVFSVFVFKGDKLQDKQRMQRSTVLHPSDPCSARAEAPA